MATQPARTRRTRERELVVATRSLFDARGGLDVPIEEIAQAVGIARGLIYRQFSSKEELYFLTVTDYLDELATELGGAAPDDADPLEKLERGVEAYARFCQRYPAFLDSALMLMKHPTNELREIVSEAVWLRLGQAIVRCVEQLALVLRVGAEDGTFDVDDADYTANIIWTQVLGTMHLARMRVGIRQAAPGIPALFEVEPERVVRTCVATALATAGARR
jgi:AcrR family transcriptional regulator